MCGIFGYISDEKNVETNIIKKIILESKKRGRDSVELFHMMENIG